MKRITALAIGSAASLAATLLWHGPGGAGDRFAGQAEQVMRATLDHYEMPGVAVRMERDPLTRRLVFDGPADSFQRSEIRRIGREVPGIANTLWVGGDRPRALPLIAEAMLMALAAFATGVILAYVAALRRRALDTFDA